MRSHFLYQKVLLITFLIVCTVLFTQAQDPEPDTTGIIEKIVGKIDTLVRTVVPDSTLEKWSDQSIDSMLLRNADSKFKKELYNLIVKSGGDTIKTPTANTTFAAMDGRIIRSISFMNVDMFAPSVTDTGYTPASWFEKIANASHNDTRKSILERYLLLKPGDKLDVFLTAENERILRDLSFIMDARFIAKPVDGNPDSIDLLLITQDKFPIGFSAQLERTTLAVLGMSHQNMLGYGHQFSATSYWDTKNSPHIGYSLSYGTTNLGGTFTSGRMDYIHRWNQETFVLDFSRDFRAISLENAGGFTFENTRLIQHVHLLDTIYEYANFRYSVTDLWTGRVIMPVSQQTHQTRTGLYLAARFYNYNNISEPSISDIYLYPFTDRIRALVSMGISKQGFRKDNLIYTFGRTEDVPFGYQFDITWGGEWLPDKARPYFSLGSSYGTYLQNSSYFFAQIRYGTFFYKGNSEQGALRLQTNYFSRLHKYGKFQYRNFMSLSFTKGINRYPGEYITLSNRGGIEGLSSTSLRGNDKLVLNLESVIFSPYVLFGFRFAFFGGLDLGLIKREDEHVLDSQLFSGINFGVRIRNDQLVFNTFVIRLALYPGRPSEGSAQNFAIDHVPRIRFNDFLPDRPEIVSYQ